MSKVVPADCTDSAAGEYTNVPKTLDVAFNWLEDSAVPYVMADGVDQLIVGAVLTGGAEADDPPPQPTSEATKVKAAQECTISAEKLEVAEAARSIGMKLGLLYALGFAIKPSNQRVTQTQHRPESKPPFKKEP